MSSNFISSDMIRGHIDTIILLSLIDGDKHTNEIRDEIESKADGKYKVKQGTFYSALQRLSKQGFVSEYRSSTADSIRRKYLHLTEKGLNYVNKNIDEWNYSKNIINNLISDDEPLVETPTIKSFPIENAQTEFDNLLNSTEISADFTVNEDVSEELDDYFSQLNTTLQNELENSTPVEENLINNEVFEENLVENDEFEQILQENTQEIIEDTEYIEDNTEEIFVDTQDFVETQEIEEFSQNSSQIEGYTELIENNTVIEETIENNQEFELEKQVLAETTETTEELQEENLVDNSYVNDEILFGDDKKEVYAQLLDKLFPENAPVEPIIEKPIIEENTASIETFEDLVLTTDETTNIEQELTEEVVYDEKPAFNYSIKKQTYDNNVKFDYSDIIDYANQEGFKVKTSYTTNKSEIGKVLVNKLKFHTAWLFFFTLIAELAIVYFVFKTNNGLKLPFYLVSSCVFLVLPIIYTINYFTEKNKAINNLTAFKNSLEVVFIICLNLILLISAFAIISDINFSSTKDLLRYIILPVLLVINIPLYYIFKYLLLQKNTYYTR